jgi:ornithine cyclodeaminase/alanine dehydrogenase-like protein (mu-crystallin family)
VEDGFRQIGAGGGGVVGPGVLAAHVDGGGFHVKTAGIRSRRFYFTAKVNANFPSNPSARGLPTIQGVLSLFDAESGEVLAVMDSTEITGLRTAAASAVAARHLARKDARRLTIIGCGAQGLHHARAMRHARPIDRITLCDLSQQAAVRLADQLRSEGMADVAVATDHRAAARAADIVVTCTTSSRPILDAEDLPPGGFVAAVGADSEHKSEISPAALRRSAVVVDILEQCATIGDLHHAIAAGAVTREHVRADLATVVSMGARFDPGETILFDSTGTAIQDVAAAAIVYETAVARRAGTTIDLASS